MDETVFQILGNLRAEKISVEDFESAIYCKGCDVLLLFCCYKRNSNIITIDIPVSTRGECESSSN